MPALSNAFPKAEIAFKAPYRQGLFLGRLAGIGFDLQARAGFEALSDEIVSSSCWRMTLD